MPNALAKNLELMFEEVIETFDSQCVLSKEAAKSMPGDTMLQRAGDVFYVRQDYNANVVTGLDISAATPTDVIQRFVPVVFRQPDNTLIYLDAKEMRDEATMREMGKASARRLAAAIDANLYSTTALNAGIVVKKVGALTWDDASLAEALLLTRGTAPGSNKKLFMNAFDWRDIGKDLGNRAYMGDLAKDAYTRAQVPNIAGFTTFRTDNVYNLAAVGTVTGTTVNGAQSFSPSAMGANNLPTDNRSMTLTVAGANIANTKLGDAFTIAGVNAVHNIDKSDTGQLMTFRIIGGAGTTSLTITPAIVASGPYQNVTAAAANGAALTFLNTATKPVNPFWCDGAVTLDYGRLAFPSDMGPKVLTANTKQGVPIIMAYDFNSLTGRASVRCTTFYATNVRDPERTGVILANQT